MYNIELDGPDEPQYKPNDIRGPWGGSSSIFPYDGAFGNRNWEMVASHFFSVGQKKNEWPVLVDFHPKYNTEGMVRDGFLRIVYKKIINKSQVSGMKKLGVMLTPKAIERLVQHTDPVQSTYTALFCDNIIEIVPKLEDNRLSGESSAPPSDCSSSRQKAEPVAL